MKSSPFRFMALPGLLICIILVVSSFFSSAPNYFLRGFFIFWGAVCLVALLHKETPKPVMPSAAHSPIGEPACAFFRPPSRAAPGGCCAEAGPHAAHPRREWRREDRPGAQTGL